MSEESRFICVLCGKDFLNEESAITHITCNPHNKLVYLEAPGKNAIPFSEYLKGMSQDAEVLSE